MKFLILFFPLLGFSFTEAPCNRACNETPLIQSISFSPPGKESEEGQMTLSGDFFNTCKEDFLVSMANKELIVTAGNTTEILATVNREDYNIGTYRVKVTKRDCKNRYDVMDATIVSKYGNEPGDLFTKRQTAPFSIFPHSYAEVEVACAGNELAISGGFAFSTWEIKLVSSFPDGRYWRFKIYNNENITSMANEFYVICVR